MAKRFVMECDRCKTQADADATLSTVTLTPPKSKRGRSPSGTSWDVCASCSTEFGEWIGSPGTVDAPAAPPAE